MDSIIHKRWLGPRSFRARDEHGRLRSHRPGAVVALSRDDKVLQRFPERFADPSAPWPPEGSDSSVALSELSRVGVELEHAIAEGQAMQERIDALEAELQAEKLRSKALQEAVEAHGNAVPSGGLSESVTSLSWAKLQALASKVLDDAPAKKDEILAALAEADAELIEIALTDIG